MEETDRFLRIFPRFGWFCNQVSYGVTDRQNTLIATASIRRNFFQSIVYQRFPCFSKTVCKIEFAEACPAGPITLVRPFALTGRSVHIYDSNQESLGHIRSNWLFTKFSVFDQVREICRLTKDLKSRWRFQLNDLLGNRRGTVDVDPEKEAVLSTLISHDYYEARWENGLLPARLIVPTFLSLHLFFCFPWILPVGARSTIAPCKAE